MLLAIDMGNTQTALGLFDGDELVHAWRMPTDRTLTKDELHVRLLGYFHKDGLDLGCVHAIAFAGVVPQLMREWEGVARDMGARLMVVGRETAAVTSIDAPNPAEVGADRIANATAAAALYGAPSIVVDFGTATNIDVVDERGAYIGGCIAPGIRISLDALTARAARLASVPLTVEAVQSGTVVGAAAMAEGLIARIKRELDCEDATVIATGGLSRMIASETSTIDIIDGLLTLKGLRLLYERNARA